VKIAKQEVTLLDWMGSDLSVVNAARVSFDKESDFEYHDCPGGMISKLSDKDQKLIKYLAKHNHKSPFNHCFASFRVKAPIFVARQLVKHEYMPWNEVSRRYVDSEPEMHAMQWRWAAENVKQGSGEVVDEITQKMADEAFWALVERSVETYNYLLRIRIAPEQARAALLLDTMTEWIWSGSLFAIAKMVKLRVDNHAQQEAQEVAQKIAEEMSRLYPHSWGALMEN
jgi:thymidylate synthase (FAD)